MPEPAAGREPSPPLRVVLDTNVHVSGTILSRGTPFEVLEAWRRQAYILVASQAILAEIERVLRTPRIRDRYAVAEQDVVRLLESLHADAVIVAGEPPAAGICADPDDDKFLTCALAGGADCIVTGDLDLLELGGTEGIAILKPAEFLERLGATA